MDPKTPILVGVGTCFDDVEASELMVRATEAAGRDSGASDLLGQVQRISVTRGTWAYTDPARIVAHRIGAAGATTVLVDVGIPQQTVLDETMALLRDGRIDVAVVVGAEAKARAARARSSSTKADAAGIANVFMGRGTDEGVASETDQGGAVPDVHQHPADLLVDPAEIAAGLWAPIDQYALMESALGAAEERSIPELRAEVAELHARFNTVAQHNPEASFPAPMSAENLAAFSPSNRPLSFPYGKWHVTQWTVDQAAALVFTTVETAERLGVPRDRWVFPLVGLGSTHTLPLTQRRDMHRWPAMAVLRSAAESHLGYSLADCELHELYSCFPVAVRIQQRELGLPLDATPTVTGGMAFAGGPFNSYVFQSLAVLARRLRAEGGRGVITSVSGLLTKPGLGVWSSDPGVSPVLLADLGDEAAAATPTVAVVASHHGPGTIAAVTVTHTGHDPDEVIAIVDTDEGARVIARSRDSGLVRQALTSVLVGTPVVVEGDQLR
jgi:acetyl-CoA C-acetyltransferase